jgi:hypothetical protein
MRNIVRWNQNREDLTNVYKRNRTDKKFKDTNKTETDKKE